MGAIRQVQNRSLEELVGLKYSLRGESRSKSSESESESALEESLDEYEPERDDGREVTSISSGRAFRFPLSRLVTDIV